MANSFLYDVVRVGPSGEALSILAGSVSLTDAIYAHDGADEPVVIVPSSSHPLRSDVNFTSRLEPSSVAPNASNDDGDSDAIEGTEHAADGEYRIDSYAEERARFVQKMLERHLTQVLNNIEWVADCGDVGIVARSLQQLCDTIGNDCDDDSDAYRQGADGGWRNDELEEALGMVPETEEATS